MRGYFCIGFIYFWLTLSAPQGVGGGGGGGGGVKCTTGNIFCLELLNGK